MNEMDQLTRFRATVPLGVRPQAEQLFHTRMQRELTAGSIRPGHEGTAAPRTGHHRRTMLIGGTAGVVATAAAVAVALVAAPSGSPTPAGPAAAPRTTVAPTRPAAGHSTPATPATAASRLAQLAAYIATTARQPGDATLVARTTTLPPGNPQAGTYRVYDLYTDRGPYYFGRTRSALAEAVAGHHTEGGGEFADEVAAARYAVHGDLAVARTRMAELQHAPTQGMSNTLVKFEASLRGVTAAPGQSLRAAVDKVMTDNYVWENSQDALVAGAGDPQVRAGVLRLLTTVSGITVSSGSVGGQPTLVVAEVTQTAVPAAHRTFRHFHYQEALTLDARTGIPIGFVGSTVGQKQPDTTVTYQVTRVSLAAVAAGRF